VQKPGAGQTRHHHTGHWPSTSEGQHTDLCYGSIPEQITLDTLGSADERKAEFICRLISGLFFLYYFAESEINLFSTLGRSN
jgi:hypothetical protein